MTTIAWLALVLLLSLAGDALAQDRQSPDDAWFTGPMLAPSANTLPPGHFLVEPYLFDVIVRGRFDRDGVRRSVPRVDAFGSLTYMLYGVADGFTLGVVPVAGYNRVRDGRSSSRVGVGDVTMHVQLRLHKARPDARLPALALVLQRTLPTGRYDRLGDRPSDGFGSGAHTTTVAVYSQKYFWLPTGRILRMRFNVSGYLSGDADVRDVSVYGTAAGFRGVASPGNALYIDAAWEYSLTRRWVLALDATYRRDGSTRVVGTDAAANSVRLDSGSSEVAWLAPAVEYSWSGSMGVLIGTRVVPVGRNATSSVTPVIAFNFVH